MINQPLVKVSNLVTGYGAVQVLWDIHLDVRESEIVCIVGANGAGKSTLLNAILGAVPAWGGTIHFGDSDITKTGSPERVKMGIGFAPEGRHLFYGLSVEDNLLMGAFQRARSSGVKEDLAMIYRLFAPLAEFKKRMAGSLSGGEQQMCAIGRALMARPRLLIIDELSLGLAPIVVDDLIDILSGLKRDRGLAILIVEQDVQVALDLSDRGYVLESGRVTRSGNTRELAADDHIREAYLGLSC
jgi:branched-chain amino acid transport system ATP-binding protein